MVLGWEGSRSDAGGVCLDNSNDLLDVPPLEREAGNNAAQAGVGAGDVGVSSPIEIQKQGLASLDEDLLVCLLRMVLYDNVS